MFTALSRPIHRKFLVFVTVLAATAGCGSAVKPPSTASGQGDAATDGQPATDAVADTLTGTDVVVGPDADGTATTAGPDTSTLPDAGAACAGVDCDDKNACTNDTCTDGKCQHVNSGCDDGNLCTDDSCDDSVKACGHKPNTLPCDDGNACTEKDVCDKSACKPGAGKVCDDADACTDDSCEGSTGQCMHAKKAGCVTALPPCDSKAGISCSKGVCDEAKHVCMPCLKSKDCGDAGYVCSQRKCVSAATCQSGADCKATKQVCNKADGICVDCVTTDDCGTDQKCVESKCIAAPKCKSDKDCDGVCDTKAGVCVGCVASADCKAGSFCAAWGQCVSAACTGAACAGNIAWFQCNGDGGGYTNGVECGDNNKCTIDNCLPGTGCAYPLAADGTPCGDGNTCSSDTCKSGKCVVVPSKFFDVVFAAKAINFDAGISLASLPDGFCLAGAKQDAGFKNDLWLARTDGAGNVEWENTLGGPGYDGAHAIVKVADGLAVAGYTTSNGSGNSDAWLIKVDESGNKLWDKTFGGKDTDMANAVVAVSDGFVLAGSTASKGAGGHDFWLVRTDALGQLIWENTYGGPSYDDAYALVALPDGFAIAGGTQSKGSAEDFWLVRTDMSGKAIWDMAYGGNLKDEARAIAALPDGFVLAGVTYSQGDGGSMWLVRVDATGKQLWEKTYGTVGYNNGGASAVAAFSGGLAIVGHKDSQIRLVQVDLSGNMLWDKSFGAALGSNNGTALAVFSNGFAIAGTTGAFSETKARLIRTDAFGNLACAVGPCATKAATDCDDKNPCTADLCDAVHGGCFYANLANGAACAAGKTCKSGVCQ